MSETALNLKWRPQVFSELEGQSSIHQILTQALQSKTLHPSLIFSGPRGTGKTSCARILAKALRCEKNKKGEPCGKCSSCLEIKEGHDMDVTEIDGASHNGVDAVRELKESVQYMPSTGKYRVYIIDEVHMLSQSAFNSLLKTLEEPPQHVVFIMATTELRKIPATVMSRCQILHFRPISGDLILKKLKVICKAEKIQADESALRLIVEQAQGSMRDAQVLLDQMSCLSHKNISSEIIIQSLALIHRSFLNSILKALIEKDTKKILQELKSLDQVDPHSFLNQLLIQIRNLVMVSLLEKTSSLVFLTKEEIQYLKKLSQKVSSEDIHILFDMCLKSREDLAYSFDARIALEMTLIRMSQCPNIEPLLSRNTINPREPACLSSSVENNSLKQKSTKSPSPSSINPPSAKLSPANPVLKRPSLSKQAKEQTPSNPGSLSPIQPEDLPQKIKQTSPDKLLQDSSLRSKKTNPTAFSPIDSKTSPEEKWKQFLLFIQEKDPRMAAEMRSFSMCRLENQSLTLSYPKSLLFLKEKTTQSKFLNYLDQLLLDFFGKKMKCHFSSDELISSYSAKALQEKQIFNKKIQKAQSHPLAQKITNLFQAQVIKEKVTRPK